MRSGGSALRSTPQRCSQSRKRPKQSFDQGNQNRSADTTRASHHNSQKVGDLMGHINAPNKGTVQVNIRRLSNGDVVSVGPQVVTSTGTKPEPAKGSGASRVVEHITGPAMTGEAIWESAISETAVAMKAVSNAENFLIPGGTNVSPLSAQTKDICDHWPVPCPPRPDSVRSSAAT